LAISSRCSFGAKVAPAVKGTRSWGGVHRSGSVLAESGKDAVTPDGNLLMHGGPDRLVRVYDVLTDKELACLSGHVGTILAVAISNDGKYAATASSDATVLVWELPAALRLGGTRKYGWAMEMMSTNTLPTLRHPIHGIREIRGLPWLRWPRC
jgi:WD40 repeat protein